MYVNFVKIYQKGTADEEYDGPTGLADVTNNQTFEIYPNPVHDVIILSQNAAKITLYDLSGHVLLKGTNLSELNVSTYQSGMYLLQLEDHNGCIEILKVIKQ